MNTKVVEYSRMVSLSVSTTEIDDNIDLSISMVYSYVLRAQLGHICDMYNSLSLQSIYVTLQYINTNYNVPLLLLIHLSSDTYNDFSPFCTDV